MTGTRPAALLLDFGGVVVETSKPRGWSAAITQVVRDRYRVECGDEFEVDAVRLERDIRSGAAADAYWKNAMSRPSAPRELTYEEFWGDLVAADWPMGPRGWVVQHARELCRSLGEVRENRVVRPGITELLAVAERGHVPVVVVSNALMGDVHRCFLRDSGIADGFAAQIYSDEAGIRKPNPELIRLAAVAVGAQVGECWYAGDNYDRDVLCGIRAGVGLNVLVTARGTADQPYELDVEPDVTVDDPRGLVRLLEEAVRNERVVDA